MTNVDPNLETSEFKNPITSFKERYGEEVSNAFFERVGLDDANEKIAKILNRVTLDNLGEDTEKLADAVILKVINHSNFEEIIINGAIHSGRLPNISRENIPTVLGLARGKYSPSNIDGTDAMQLSAQLLVRDFLEAHIDAEIDIHKARILGDDVRSFYDQGASV